jgi:uncharacterized membrane protein
MSTITLFKRWTVKKLYFWILIGLIPVLCIASFLAAAMISGGRSYSSAYDMVEMEAPSYGFAGGADGFAVNEEAGEYYLSDDDGDYDEKAYDDAGTATVSTNGASAAERLIIREGNISIYTEQTRQTRDDIEAIVADFASQGGYVINASESSRGEGKEPYISMSIRVPVDQFDYVMDAIAEMGIEVISSNESAQDVTEEYVDLEGRIEALEASRDRLLELMADAEFTEDLLQAEQELTIREAELESYYGRLNYLAESARLSRIYIDLQPYELYEPIDTSWKPAETLRYAIEDLIESLQGFADIMIVFAIVVLPWLVFFGLIIWGVVAIVRRRRRKKQAASES